MRKALTGFIILIGSLTTAANGKTFLQHNLYIGPLYSMYGFMDVGDNFLGSGINYEFRINQFGANLYLQNSPTRMFDNYSPFSNHILTLGLYSDTERSFLNGSLFLGFSYMKNTFPGIGLSINNNYKWFSLKAMGYLGYNQDDFIQGTWALMIGTYLIDAVKALKQ